MTATPQSLLKSFRDSLPHAGAPQIGAARVALLREIAKERETAKERGAGQSNGDLPTPPPPRLTLTALVAAVALSVILVLLLFNVVALPH